MKYTFKGNFGTLELVVDENGNAQGTYQEGGILKGIYKEGDFEGEWINKGMDGLVQFSVAEGQLNGTWKKGLDKGPMRGKWKGKLIDLPKDTTEQITKEKSNDDWNIIHDIFSFYTFFANLANEGSQEVENKFVQTEIKKWKIEINGVKYGLDYGSPQNFVQLADSVFNALYMDGDSTDKDPFIQLNESHYNMVGYFNQGVLNCSMITTLWSSMIKLCQLRGITELQHQQLRWYLEQWSSVCSDLSVQIKILDFAKEVAEEEAEEMAEEAAEEVATEQQTESKKYPLFPVNWGVENVIIVPIRHCIVTDNVVNQMERNLMAHFFENFGEIGEMAGLEWDITDDQIMQIQSDGKYGELLVDSAIYLRDNLDNDQLSKLIWYMANIVSEDKIIQYTEFVTLKFFFDQWFPDALDTYIEKFKAAGMTVITSPNN